MRRNLTLLAFALALALSGLVFAANDAINVHGGLISGTTADGVRGFKGIPFAAPPVGDLRWKAPQPVVAWEGVRKCETFGPECPQAPYPAGSMYASPPQKQSEDCLYLNVWTAARSGEKRPVMVWIHGGALTRGSDAADDRDAGTSARERLAAEPDRRRGRPAGDRIYFARVDLA